MLRISSTNLASGNFLCTFCKRWRREGRGFKVMSIPGDYELRYITSCQNTVRWSMERFPQLRHSSSYGGPRFRGFDVSATSAKSTNLEVKAIRDGASSASKSASSILIRKEWTRAGRTSTLLAADADDVVKNRTDSPESKWTRNQIHTGKCKAFGVVTDYGRATASASPNRTSKAARLSPSEDSLARRTQKMLQRSNSMRSENLGKFEKTIKIKSDYKMWQGEAWPSSKSAGSYEIGRKMAVSRETVVQNFGDKRHDVAERASESNVSDDRAGKDYARFQEVLQVPDTLEVEQILHVQDLRRREKSKPKARKSAVNSFRVSDPFVRQRLLRNKINAEIYDQVQLLEKVEPQCEFAEIQCGRKKLYIALLEEPPEEAVSREIPSPYSEKSGEPRKGLPEPAAKPPLREKLAAMAPEKIALVTPEKIAKMIGAGTNKSSVKQMKIVREWNCKSASGKSLKPGREKPVKLEIPKKGGDFKVVVNLKKSGKELTAPTVHFQQKTPEGIVGNTMKFQVKKMEKYWFATPNGKVRIQYLTGVLTNMKNRLRERMDVFRCPVTLPDQGKIVFYGKSADSKPPDESPHTPTPSSSAPGTPTASSPTLGPKQSIARRLKLLNTKKSDPASTIKKETERKYLFRILRRKARKVANDKVEAPEEAIKTFPKLDAITRKAARADAKDEEAAAAAQTTMDKMAKDLPEKEQSETLDKKEEPVEEKPQTQSSPARPTLESPFEKKAKVTAQEQEGLLKPQVSLKETEKPAKPVPLGSKPFSAVSSVDSHYVTSVARERVKIAPPRFTPEAAESERNAPSLQEQQGSGQQTMEDLSRWRPDSQWTVPQASENMWEEVPPTSGDVPQQHAWPQGAAQNQPEQSFKTTTLQQAARVPLEQTSSSSQDGTCRVTLGATDACRLETDIHQASVDHSRESKGGSYQAQKQMEGWQTQEVQNQQAEYFESRQAQHFESQQAQKMMQQQLENQRTQQILQHQQAQEQVESQQAQQMVQDQQIQQQIQNYPFDEQQQNSQSMQQQNFPDPQSFSDSQTTARAGPGAMPPQSTPRSTWDMQSNNDQWKVQQHSPSRDSPAQNEQGQRNKSDFYYPEMVSERTRLSRRPNKPRGAGSNTLQFTALEGPFVPVRVISDKDMRMYDISEAGPVRQPIFSDTDPVHEPEQDLSRVPKLRKLAGAVSGGTIEPATSELSSSFVVETETLADFAPHNSFDYNYDHELELTSFEKVVAENFTRVDDVDLIDVKRIPTMSSAANRPEAFPGFAFDNQSTSDGAPREREHYITLPGKTEELSPLTAIRTLPSEPEKKTSGPDRKETKKPAEPRKDVLQVTAADDEVIQKLKDELSSNLRNEWKAKLFDELAEKIKPVIEFKILPKDEGIPGLDKAKSLGDLGMEEELKEIRNEIERIKQKVGPKEKRDDDDDPKYYRRLAMSPVLICDESFLRPRVKQGENDDYSYYRKSVSVPIMAASDDAYTYGQTHVPGIGEPTLRPEPLESPHIVTMVKGDEVKTTNPPTQSPSQQPSQAPQSTPSEKSPSNGGQEKQSKPPPSPHRIDPKDHPYLPKDPDTAHSDKTQRSPYAPQHPYQAYQTVQTPPTPQSPYHSHQAVQAPTTPQSPYHSQQTAQTPTSPQSPYHTRQTVEVRAEPGTAQQQTQQARQGSSPAQTINPKDHPYLPNWSDTRQHQQQHHGAQHYKPQETSTHPHQQEHQQQGAQTYSQCDQYNWYRQSQAGQSVQTQEELEEQRRRYFEYYANFHQQPQPAPTQAELEEQRRKQLGQDGKTENRQHIQEQAEAAMTQAATTSPSEIEEQRRRYFDYYAKYQQVPSGYESTSEKRVAMDSTPQHSDAPEEDKRAVKFREQEKTPEVQQTEADKAKPKEEEKPEPTQVKMEKTDGEKAAKESKPVGEKGGYLKNLLLAGKSKGKEDKKVDANKPPVKPSEIRLKDLPPAKPDIKKQAEKAGGDNLSKTTEKRAAAADAAAASEREEKLRKHKEEAALQLRAQQEAAAKRDAEEKKKQDASRTENDRKRKEDVRRQNIAGFTGYGLEIVPQETYPVLPIPPDKKPDESKEKKKSDEKKIKFPGPDAGTSEKKSKLDVSEAPKQKPSTTTEVSPSRVEDKSSTKKDSKVDAVVKPPEKPKIPEPNKVETAPKAPEKTKPAEATTAKPPAAKTETTPQSSEKPKTPEKPKMGEVKKTETRVQESAKIVEKPKTPEKKTMEQAKTESKKVEQRPKTGDKPKAPEKKPETNVKSQSAAEKSKAMEALKTGEKKPDAGDQSKPSVTNVEKKASTTTPTTGGEGDKTPKKEAAPKKVEKKASDKATKVDDAKEKTGKSEKKFWDIGRRKSESFKEKMSTGDKVIGLFLNKEKKPGETPASEGDKTKKTPEKKARADEKGEKKTEGSDPPKIVPASKGKKEPSDKEKEPKMDASSNCLGGREPERRPTSDADDGSDGKPPDDDGGSHSGGGASSPPIMSASLPFLDIEQYNTTCPNDIFAAGVESYAFDQYLSTEDAEDILRLNRRCEPTVTTYEASAKAEEPEMTLHKSPSVKVLRIFVVNNRKEGGKVKKVPVEVEERLKENRQATTESLDILAKAFSSPVEESLQLGTTIPTTHGETLHSGLFEMLNANANNQTSSSKGSRGTLGSAEAFRRVAATEKEEGAGSQRKAVCGKQQEMAEESKGVVASDPGHSIDAFQKAIDAAESRQRKHGSGEEKKESDLHSFHDVLKADVVGKEMRAPSPFVFAAAGASAANLRTEAAECSKREARKIPATITEIEDLKDSFQRKKEAEQGDFSHKSATEEPMTGKGKVKEDFSDSCRVRLEPEDEGKVRRLEERRNSTPAEGARKRREFSVRGKENGTEDGGAEAPSKAIPEVLPRLKEDDPPSESPMRAEAARPRIRQVREVSPKPKKESFVEKDFTVREESFEIELVPSASDSMSPSRRSGSSSSRRGRDRSESVTSTIRTARSEREDRRGKRPRTILPDSPNADFVYESKGTIVREEMEPETAVEPESSGGRKEYVDSATLGSEQKLERVKRAVREELTDSEPVTFLPPKPRDRKTTGYGKTTKKGASGRETTKRELRTLSEAMLKHFEAEAFETGREGSRREARGEERAASAESILGEKLRSRIASVPQRKTQMRVSEKEMSAVREKTELKTVRVVEEPQRRERPGETDPVTDAENSYQINLEAIARKASAIPCAVAVDPEEQPGPAVYPPVTEGSKSKSARQTIPKFWWQKVDSNRK